MMKLFKRSLSIDRSLVGRPELTRGALKSRSLRFSSTSFKAEAIDGRRAAHCMFWAKTNSTAIGNTPMKALIMMQVRIETNTSISILVYPYTVYGFEIFCYSVGIHNLMIRLYLNSWLEIFEYTFDVTQTNSGRIMLPLLSAAFTMLSM